VLERGIFILGPEVAAFEAEFAALSGARHAIAVASGTDALRLALVALGIKPGDEVITAAMTFAATALAIETVGASVSPPMVAVLLAAPALPAVSP